MTSPRDESWPYPTEAFKKQPYLFGRDLNSAGCNHQSYKCTHCDRIICEKMLGIHWANHVSELAGRVKPR